MKRSAAQFALEEARRANTLLEFPGKISADEKGSRLFITDSNHDRILVADAAGNILDVIGSGAEGRGDGTFEEAQFLHPQGTFLSGDVLYIADTENHLIRAADLRRTRHRYGTVTRTRSVAKSPWDLLVQDGKMYIAMAGSHQLWVADLKTWQAQPYAGSGREDITNGKLSEAALAQPSGIATDGRKLYFADSETSSIREADLNPSGRVRTIVGQGLFEFGDIDGGSLSARLQHPLGVAFRDGQIYVADTYNSKIKVVDPVKATVRTLAGSGKKTLADGKFASAAFNEPGGLAWLNGKLYVADTNNHQIRDSRPRGEDRRQPGVHGAGEAVAAADGQFSRPRARSWRAGSEGRFSAAGSQHRPAGRLQVQPRRAILHALEHIQPGGAQVRTASRQGRFQACQFPAGSAD